MIMLVNVAVLLLLSLIPAKDPHADPHGLQRLVNEDAYRQLLLDGRFGEYGAALDGALSARFAAELKAGRGNARGVSPATVRDAILGGKRSDLGELFAGIKTAIAVATLATELHTLGPAKALSMALSWVESGLIRKSGLRAADFGSFYRIVSHPNRARLSEDDLSALEADARDATGTMNTGFGNLYGRLTELFF